MAVFWSNPNEGGRLRCLGPDKQQWWRTRKLRTRVEFTREHERGRARAAFKGSAGSRLDGGGRGNKGAGGLAPNNEKRMGYGSRQRHERGCSDPPSLNEFKSPNFIQTWFDPKGTFPAQKNRRKILDDRVRKGEQSLLLQFSQIQTQI
jgi:hypothetical protein